jgi:hypothetical protein
MDIQFFLNNLWRWKCGLPETEEANQVSSYEGLKESEWSEDFEKLMRNRLIIGALRYGKIGAANKPQYDRVNSMIKRLTKYQETGNKEFLVVFWNLSNVIILINIFTPLTMANILICYEKTTCNPPFSTNLLHDAFSSNTTEN